MEFLQTIRLREGLATSLRFMQVRGHQALRGCEASQTQGVSEH